jgi:hypothetical protein
MIAGSVYLNDNLPLVPNEAAHMKNTTYCDAIGSLVYRTPENIDLRTTTVTQSEATAMANLLKEHSTNGEQKASASMHVSGYR